MYSEYCFYMDSFHGITNPVSERVADRVFSSLLIYSSIYLRTSPTRSETPQTGKPNAILSVCSRLMSTCFQKYPSPISVDVLSKVVFSIYLSIQMYSTLSSSWSAVAVARARPAAVQRKLYRQRVSFTLLDPRRHVVNGAIPCTVLSGRLGKICIACRGYT